MLSAKYQKHYITNSCSLIMFISVVIAIYLVIPKFLIFKPDMKDGLIYVFSVKLYEYK